MCLRVQICIYEHHCVSGSLCSSSSMKNKDREVSLCDAEYFSVYVFVYFWEDLCVAVCTRCMNVSMCGELLFL